MISSEKDFLQFLDKHSFVYQRVEHPAVFTCAEAELHRPRVPAVSTKNLFLCDIRWLGYLQSLWVDTYGNLREDTDNDKSLNVYTDKMLSFYLDPESGE